MVGVHVIVFVEFPQPFGFDLIIGVSELQTFHRDAFRLIQQLHPHPDRHLIRRIVFLRHTGARHCDGLLRVHILGVLIEGLQDLDVSLESAFVDLQRSRLDPPGSQVFAVFHILGGWAEVDHAVGVAMDHIVAPHRHDIFQQPSPGI